jgi:hypothetical protein
MLLGYFLNDFEMVPDAPIITGITFVVTFHMRCISVESKVRVKRSLTRPGQALRALEG